MFSANETGCYVFPDNKENKYMRNYTLITGASSGIGKSLTYLFAKDGKNLILVSRSKDELDKLASELKSEYCIDTIVIAQDLAESDAVKRVYSLVKESGIHVENLVNNAGFGIYGEFSETPIDVEIDMINVNVSALTELTKLFLQDMKELNSGRIMNVASTAAFQPGPLMSVYYASKAYVLSFSEALANELRNTGITVTVLCPGPTDTGFMDRANLHESKLFSGKLKTTPVQYVAEVGYKGMLSGKTIVVPGLSNKILTKATRFAPRKLVTSIVRNIQEKR